MANSIEFIKVANMQVESACYATAPTKITMAHSGSLDQARTAANGKLDEMRVAYCVDAYRIRGERGDILAVGPAVSGHKDGPLSSDGVWAD